MNRVAALRERLIGPMTALITPFHADGSLNADALDQHVTFQLQHDVRVLVPWGTIGEFPCLTLEERKTVAERVARANQGCAAVLVGVSDTQQSVTECLARHAAQAGADGLLVMPPPFFKLSEDEQYAFWAWLDAHVALPYVVYSSPANASGLPSYALLERVSRLPGFTGLKEASPDVARFHELMRRFGQHFPVIAAVEAPLPYTLLAGSPGLMTSTACFAPKLMWDIFEAARAGDVQRLLDRFEVVARFRDLFQVRMNQGFHAYIPFTKAACELVGLPAGDPRPPHAPISETDRGRLAAVLRDDFALLVE